MSSAARFGIVAAGVVTLLCSSSRANADLDPQLEAIGPIDVQTRYQRPAVAAYLDLRAGESFQVFLTHEDPDVASYDRYDTRLPLAVVRVYDPDENLLLHRVVDAAVDAQDYPSLAPHDLANGVLADTTLQATTDGTYTVRVSAGYEHTKLRIGVPPGTNHALSYGNGIWQDWRESLGPLWVWVPGHPTRDVTIELRHEAGSATVWGPGDLWSHDLETGDLLRTLPAGDPGQLWRVDDLTEDWMLRAGGDVPVIFATSAAYATKLDAGLVTIETGPLDGERVAHLFQKRLAELIEPLLAGVGDAADLRAAVSVVTSDPSCAEVSDVERAELGVELLARHLPSVVWSLDTWKFGGEASTHPFVDAEHADAIAPLLAWLPSFHHPCNPWGPTGEGLADGRVELLRRAALVAIDQVMSVTEDERLSEGDAFSTYPGTGAFAVGDRTWTFAFLSPSSARALPPPLGEDLRSAYVEAMRRATLDRRYAEPFVSARNQSSFYVTGLGALVLGDPSWESATRAYAERFAASADPAGWFPESLGPDATYNGMTHNQLALFYLQTAWTQGCSDQTVRAALAKSYDFFNHTVGPEPGGKTLGGFNFGHRTNWWFADEQYSGAKGIARDVPQVAIWSEPQTPLSPADIQSELDDAIQSFDFHVAQTATSASTLLHAFQRFVARQTYVFPDSHPNLRWPAQNPDTDRLFDDELYALRRDGYFVSIYVGNPASGTFYTDQKVEQIRPAAAPATCPGLYTAHYEDTGVPQPSGHAHPCATDEREYFVSHPFVGGGISTLWTPSFGAAILAANWSPLVHHGIVGVGLNPDTGLLERTWERYAAVQLIGADRDGVELHGTVPLYYGSAVELLYTRVYEFGDDSIDVKVVLTNATAVEQSLDALWENVPVPVCAADCDTNLKARVVGFARADGTPLDAGMHELDVVHVVDEQGHGLAVSFGSVREVSVHPVGMILPFYSERLQIGRIQIPFDTSVLPSGASTSLTYTLRTLDSVMVEPVPPVTDEPQILCADPPPVDGGIDAEPSDGATIEAGPDGGTPEGGPVSSATSDDAGGCGCRTSGRGANASWLMFLLGSVFLLFRARRLGNPAG